jgi:hypothetical protein
LRSAVATVTDPGERDVVERAVRVGSVARNGGDERHALDRWAGEVRTVVEGLAAAGLLRTPDADNVQLAGRHIESSREVERSLAAALGYCWYGDVDDDPPGHPDDYVIGDHTVESLALEAAERLNKVDDPASRDEPGRARQYLEQVETQLRRLHLLPPRDAELNVRWRYLSGARDALLAVLGEPDQAGGSLSESFGQFDEPSGNFAVPEGGTPVRVRYRSQSQQGTVIGDDRDRRRQYVRWDDGQCHGWYGDDELQPVTPGGADADR